MIALRKRAADLTDGDIERVRVCFDENAGWLTVERGCLAVCCNLSDREQRIEPSSDGANGLLLSSEQAVRCDEGAVRLLPDSVAVLGTVALAFAIGLALARALGL